MLVNILESLLFILYLPAFFWINFAGSREKRQVRFHHWSEFLSGWPFAFGSLARRVFYQHTLQGCGANPVIRTGTIFVHPETEIGSNVLFGNRCIIGLCTIGDDVMLSHHVSILSGRHHHRRTVRDEPLRTQGGDLKRIKIGHDVWIGACATIMANVGDRAIVGAGAVVVRPVPEGVTVVGNPARILEHA